MADIEKNAKPEAGKPDEKGAAGRKTKLIAETGRYVCREPVVFTTPDGKRAHAKAGEVVAMHENDAKPLKRRRVVDSEEETAEG